MGQDKIPVSKIDRASKFLKTGLKMGGNYAKHIGKKVTFQDSSKEDLDRANANTLFEGFSELKGSALKVAQMLSMDNVNFSASFADVMQKAQYSVPPMSAPLAVRCFSKSIGKSPEDVFDKFNPNALRAASMGQVHEAWLDGKKLAVKIQYPGVAESIKSDMKMVKSVASRVMGVSQAELGPYFEEVEGRMLEESDYRIELENSLRFADACKHLDGIVFPKFYTEYSTDRVLVMEWLEGMHQKEFLAQNPSSDLRHKLARHLWDYYEFQMHVLKEMNADPHPGNFLFRNDGTIGVLDFGCTKRLSQEVYDGYFRMADPHLFDPQNRERAQQVLLELEILRPTDTGEHREFLTDLFGRLISLIALPYHQGRFNFNNPDYYEEIKTLGGEIAKLRELRGSKDFLFINRTYFGLFSLFQHLDVEMDTTCTYHDFLFDEVREARAAAQQA